MSWWPDEQNTSELSTPVKRQRTAAPKTPTQSATTVVCDSTEDWVTTLARQRASQFANQLRTDTSAWAIKPKDPELLEAICNDFFLSTRFAHSDSTINQDKSAWKYWLQWCQHVGTPPIRDDLRALSGIDAFGMQREVWLQAGAIIFWMPGIKGRGRPQGLPGSCGKRLDGVRRIHERLGLPRPPRKMITTVIKAEMRRYAARHGPEWLEPCRKNPLPYFVIRAMLCLCLSTAWCSFDFSRQTWLVIEAIICTLVHTGLRKSELFSAAFGRPSLSRWHLRWRIKGVDLPAPTKQQLMSLQHGRDFAVLKPPPSKSDPFGSHWGSKPIYMRFDDFDPMNAAKKLRDLELDLTVPELQRRNVPLFPMSASKPFTAYVLDSLLKQMMKELIACSLVTQKEASSYSWHSFRATLATACWAAGFSVPEIQSALRWITPESVAIYAAFTPGDYADMISKALTQDIAGASRTQPAFEIDDDERVQALLDFEF
jgi:hypothetical protein